MPFVCIRIFRVAVRIFRYASSGKYELATRKINNPTLVCTRPLAERQLINYSSEKALNDWLPPNVHILCQIYFWIRKKWPVSRIYHMSTQNWYHNVLGPMPQCINLAGFGSTSRNKVGLFAHVSFYSTSQHCFAA